MTTIDNVTNHLCYWPWFSLICTYDCSSSSWLVLYLFSSTCLHHTSREDPVVNPYLDVVVDFGEMGNILRRLSIHETNCDYYGGKALKLL